MLRDGRHLATLRSFHDSREVGFCIAEIDRIHGLFLYDYMWSHVKQHGSIAINPPIAPPQARQHFVADGARARGEIVHADVLAEQRHKLAALGR